MTLADWCCRNTLQALLSLEWNLSPLLVLFWLTRADSGVSVHGGQKSLDAQKSSRSAAENVEININLLEAQITCNDRTGSWSVSPDRFQKRENVLALCLKRFPKVFGCCSTRDPEGFPSCPLWAGPAQPAVCGVVRASRQHIQTELTHQQAAKIASCPYGGGITFLNSLFWLVGVLVQELRWDLFRQLLNRYLRGELLLDCFPHRFFLRVNPCTFEHEYISDLLQQGSVQRLYLMRTELNASFHDVIIAW